jgi:hypothetical protein
VTLEAEDDGTGKHRWIIKEDAARNGYTIDSAIRVAHDCMHSHLWTASQNNGEPGVWKSGDDPKAIWNFGDSDTCDPVPPPPEVFLPVDLPTCGHLNNKGRNDVDGDGTAMVSQGGCTNRVHLRDPTKKHQIDHYFMDWDFQPVGGEAPVNAYNIMIRRPGTKCEDKVFMTSPNGCGYMVTLETEDDNSGKHWWLVEAVEGGFTITNHYKKYGMDNCKNQILYTHQQNNGEPGMGWDITQPRAVWNFDDSASCNPVEEPVAPEEPVVPAEPEPVEEEEETVNWWRRPKWNKWNFSPDWKQPQWNWRPNQGNRWRQWWRNRPQKNDYPGL